MSEVICGPHWLISQQSNSWSVVIRALVQYAMPDKGWHKDKSYMLLCRKDAVSLNDFLQKLAKLLWLVSLKAFVPQCIGQLEHKGRHYIQGYLQGQEVHKLFAFMLRGEIWPILPQ